jgi:hypothetical protein
MSQLNIFTALAEQEFAPKRDLIRNSTNLLVDEKVKNSFYLLRKLNRYKSAIS